MKKVFKNDKYKKTRGGYSRLLEICCEKCGNYIFSYQKDGPGILKRTYLDRISNSKKWAGLESFTVKEISQLICDKCKSVLGIPYIYEKEKRPAFRLFVGSVTKKITKIK